MRGRRPSITAAGPGERYACNIVTALGPEWTAVGALEMTRAPAPRQVDAVRLAYQRRIQAIWMSCERAVVERKEETPENVRSSEERRPLLNELAQGERTLFVRQLSLVVRPVLGVFLRTPC